MDDAKIINDLTGKRKRKDFFSYLYTHEMGFYEEMDQFRLRLVLDAQAEGFIQLEYDSFGDNLWEITPKFESYVKANDFVSLGWRIKRILCRIRKRFEPIIY